MNSNRTDHIQDENDRFPLEFSVPGEFTPIDLTSSPAERAEKLYGALTAYSPDLTPLQIAHLLAANQYMVERMINEGVLYAATFTGRSDRDPTAATTAQFIVMSRSSADSNQQTLPQLIEILHSQRPNCDCRLVDIPIGRCLAIVDETHVGAPRDLVGNLDAVTHKVRQIQLIYPLPDRNETACFTMSTECTRDWDEYVAMMAEISKTIRWRETPSTRIRDALDN